jgi:hypothetical protein
MTESLANVVLVSYVLAWRCFAASVELQPTSKKNLYGFHFALRVDSTKCFAIAWEELFATRGRD